VYFKKGVRDIKQEKVSRENDRFGPKFQDIDSAQKKSDDHLDHVGTEDYENRAAVISPDSAHCQKIHQRNQSRKKYDE